MNKMGIIVENNLCKLLLTLCRQKIHFRWLYERDRDRDTLRQIKIDRDRGRDGDGKRKKVTGQDSDSV